MTFALTGVVVLAGVLVFLSIGAAIVRLQSKLRTPYGAPPGWGINPDDKKWEQEAEKLAHTALADVRESAKNWAASIAALLGIGSTVAFVKGEETFAKLSPTEGNFAFWLAVSAAILAGVAIALATFAAQGTPQRFKSVDGWTLSKISRDRSQKATVLLLWSRVLAIVAAIAIFGGFGMAWKTSIATEDTTSGVSAIAATDDGTVRCGELKTASDGALSLVAGGQTLIVRKGADVDTVDSCPAGEE